MSKAIVFTDLHIHDYKQFNREGNRLENCLRVLDDIGEFAVAKDISTIFFGGDLFDTQKALLTQVVNKTVERFLNFFTKYPHIKFYAITGNHDQSTKNLIESEAESALTHLASIFPDNFLLIDNKTVEVMEGVILSGVPYYEYPEHFKEQLFKRAEDNASARASYEEQGITPVSYLMIHQTPKGIGNEMIPFDCNPKDELFNGFERTFCGHIHKRQDLTSTFSVVGSPLHRDMGDIGEQKGFYVINMLKPEKGCHFVYLKGYPEFVQKYEDEVSPEDFDNQDAFVVTKVREDNLEVIKDAKVSEFSTNLKDEELMTNFWKQVDGKDEELLKVGLEFLKS